MQNIQIKINKQTGGYFTYVVIADTQRFGMGEIMFESYFYEECINYIKRQGHSIKDIQKVNPGIDKLTQQAISKVYAKAPYLSLDNIRFKYISREEMTHLSKRTTLGCYRNGVIYLLPHVDVSLVIHELGHYVHDLYYGFKEFRFDTCQKSDYAYTNCCENFAECFMEYIQGKHTKRTEKMEKILLDVKHPLKS